MAIITEYGIYNGKSTGGQLNLIMNALKRNGATSVEIYTNAANDLMTAVLEPRRISGRGFAGLEIKKLAVGYSLKGRF